METLFAKALFDNTAESEDELAFHKGDIITVLEKNVAGSIGWWKCSLHGRQGLAPANRLGLLSPAQAENLGANLSDSLDKQSHQNIYQTPKPARPSAAEPIYEDMNIIYRTAHPHIPSPDKLTSQDDAEGTSSPRIASTAQSRTGAELYDVPSLVRRTSMFTSSTLQPLHRNKSLKSSTEIYKRYEMLQSRSCTNATNKTVCNIPPLAFQDPNYDIPTPSISDNSQKPPCIMPRPCKSEWIYDVPVLMQKQGGEPGHYITLPCKTINSNKALYDIFPARVRPERKDALLQPIYDIPRPTSAAQACVDIESCTCHVPPHLKQTETSANSALPRQNTSPENDSNRNHEPFEDRGKPGPMYDQLHRWPSRGRSLFRHPVEGVIRKDDDNNKDSQRSSTVSTSSTASSSSRSSCDSFMLSSPEPEPLREVVLSQEEAGNQLLELQEAVCQSISKLMLFVSSQWRTKEHLGRHLHQIRTATEEVTDSVTCFLNFALDVQGNAQRLTDSNLQTRLLKQLSIVEDSGLILQQAADALRGLGWLLDALAQDAGHSQTPDHLERFVMVARTVPEDVKRLVSILNANGKLLFRGPAKELDMVESERRGSRKSEPRVDSGIDDSDYVQLQTKTEEFDQQPKTAKSSFKPKKNGDTVIKQVSRSQTLGPCSPLQASRKSSISDHCRLYFGAIQKAINVFISSLNDGQPPEKFISHSKLVIMVGQRLVNTLCSEAKSREASREMLSMSNQLCAHLKQLAIVTKKAALNFPDKRALQEAQDTAKELVQRTQHFRTSLDA